MAQLMQYFFLKANTKIRRYQNDHKKLSKTIIDVVDGP